MNLGMPEYASSVVQFVQHYDHALRVGMQPCRRAPCWRRTTLSEPRSSPTGASCSACAATKTAFSTFTHYTTVVDTLDGLVARGRFQSQEY